MQSIEVIRKTNELSKILKRHGFAEDSFEAAMKANRITSKKEGSSSIIADKSQDSILLERKLSALERSKHILANRVNELSKELSEYGAVIKDLMMRMDSIESRMRRGSPPKDESPKPVLQSEDRKSVKEANQSSSPQSRDTGKIDPKFSVENVFYCGTR